MAFESLKQGNVIPNAADWQARHAIGSHITAVLLATGSIAKLMGVDLHIDDGLAQVIGLGFGSLVFLANGLLMVATSHSLGIKS